MKAMLLSTLGFIVAPFAMLAWFKAIGVFACLLFPLSYSCR